MAAQRAFRGKPSETLGGRSLVVRAIECGQPYGLLDRLIVSTDDPEIVDLAGCSGAEVPFLRPRSSVCQRSIWEAASTTV